MVTVPCPMESRLRVILPVPNTCVVGASCASMKVVARHFNTYRTAPIVVVLTTDAVRTYAPANSEGNRLRLRIPLNAKRRDEHPVPPRVSCFERRRAFCGGFRCWRQRGLSGAAHAVTMAESNRVMTIYDACSALANSPNSALFKSDTAQNDIPLWIQ